MEANAKAEECILIYANITPSSKQILRLVVAATDDPDLEQPKTRLLGRGPTE